MTYALLLFALACQPAPSDDDLPPWEAGDPDWFAPPGDLVLTVPPLAAAERAEFVVEGLASGEEVHVVASLDGLGVGPCPTYFGGTCLDVLPRILRLGSAEADLTGVARLEVGLPASSSGTELCVQAAVRRGASGADSAASRASCHPVAGPAVQWFTTCGDPVCSGWHGPFAGVPACTGEAAGDPCSSDGATCDPRDGCNALLTCAASDPKAAGCPISRREHKDDVHYLNETELQAAHAAAMDLPLATWAYLEDEPTTPRHLGLILDDAPHSPAVRPGGQRVDLYGYTSLTLAAVQAQERQLQDLRRDVRRLQDELAECAP